MLLLWQTVGEIRMPGTWATQSPCSAAHCQQGSGGSVARFGKSLATSTIKTMAFALSGRARGLFFIELGGEAGPSSATSEKAKWITASRAGCASPWRLQANFRVDRIPEERSSASSRRIVSKGMLSLFNPALTEDTARRPPFRQRGLNICR